MVDTELVVTVALAASLALAPRLRYPGWGLAHAVAAGAILYPGLDALVSFVDLAPLIGEYTVLQPYSTQRLNEMPLRIARKNLLIPALGLAAAALVGGMAVARGHLATVDKAPATWRRELILGLALVPAFMLAQEVALLLLQGPAQFLQTGDESALFANARWWHVAALCIVPAVAEEIYYRGLLQGLFEQVAPARARVWTALVLQALVFAVAHAGFTTLSHILGPLTFALAMGYLRSAVGLGACMVAHASVNLAFFAVDPGAGSLGLQVAALTVAIAGLIVLWRERRQVVGLLRRGPEALARPP